MLYQGSVVRPKVEGPEDSCSESRLRVLRVYVTCRLNSSKRVI